MAPSRHVCPSCGSSSDGGGECPRDGTPMLATDDPLLGEDVGGYRVVAAIGEGGMGRVYRGIQPSIGARVAIKVLARDLVGDPEMAERFVAEARLANVVRHDGLVNVLALGVLSDGRPYQIMELLEGRSLHAIVRRGERLAIGTLCNLLCDVLQAIAPMHERGLVHRDLKPSNLFVTTAGRIKVIDFGIAKLVSTQRGLTQTGQTLGTPEYMAPEQLEGRAVDPRTDLFALGVVLYEAATGSRPFDPLKAAATDRPPPLSVVGVVPHAPVELDHAIARALATDRDRRFASAAEMERALRDVIAKLPPQAFAPIATEPPAAAVRVTNEWGSPTVPMAMPHELVGRTLGGFVVREMIGQGGFGMVFRAEQPILEREAVIKVLRTSDRTPSFVERFLREARLASRLDHPFAAHVYAFGAEPDGLLWIAMERVRGTPLDEIIADRPIAIERLVPLVERLCEVIQTAHDQGIVHRDVKPANVIAIVRAGRLLPKLIDFGIAIAGVSESDHVGSPPYMAPESWIAGASLDHRVDLYALGVVIYEALTGRLPFGDRTAFDLGRAHLQRAVPPLGGGLSPALDDVIARAMAKRPEDRFDSALDLAAALRAASGMPSDELPQLDDAIRAHAIAEAPRPLAEAVAALESVATRDQLDAAIDHVVDVLARWLGALAVAARTRIGPDGGDPPRAAELLGAIVDRPLGAREWLDLANELTARYRDHARRHPIPELVSVVGAIRAPLERLFDDRSADDTGARRRIAVLAGVLDATRRLDDYAMIVPRTGDSDVWMGVRRPRPRAGGSFDGLVAGEPVLVDRESVPVVALWPLVSILRPSPMADEEAFFLDGRTRFGVRVAAPVGIGRRFERHDDDRIASWHRTRFGSARRARASSTTPVERAPYRGLAAFTRDDADLFFGRELEAEAFANRLRSTPLLAIVGPSGAGKSSFVQAGVLPRLPETWRSIVVRPGATPIASLAAKLAAAGIAVDPARDPHALGEALAATGPGFVLVVDQFEELITLCRDADERDAYVAALVAAADRDDGVRVVITIRDDFLLRLQRLRGLRDRLAYGLALLETPDADDLRRIVLEPARRAGYELDDPALVDDMVRDVADRPGALALLSFTASRLWELRDRHFQRMTRSAYDALGGVGGALAQHAEETLAALGDNAAAREAFRHLVTADKTRAVIERGELVELIAKGASSTTASADKVIERLVAARLLLASEGGAGGGDLVEVIHEALLVSWPRLVAWQHEDAENVRLRDQLRSAARQWEARRRPRGLLWRGDALLELRLWRVRYPGALTATEDAFDRASIADENRGRRRRRAILGVALVGLAATAITFAWLRGEAETNRRSATASAAEARARLLDSYVETGRRALVAGDPGAAIDFLDRASRAGVDTPAIRFMIARAKESTSADAAWLRGHDGLLWDIAFSPEATRVATASDDGTVRVWSTAGDAILRIDGLPKKRVDLAWSPDGKTIATAADGNVQLWDAALGTLRGELRGHVGPVASVGFSPDGRSIVTAAGGAGDDTIRVWDVSTSTGRVIETIDSDSHNFASWSADGRWIAIATTRLPGMVPSAVVVHGRAGTRSELTGHTAGVWYAYVDPSGNRVASASLDRTARIWDLTTGRELHVLRGHDDRVTDVAWSPDGKELATASADGTVRLWSASDGKTRVVLRGHAAQVNRVRFGDDGRTLYSAGNDGLAMVWDAQHGIQLAAFNHGGFVFQIDLAGTTLASASWLGTGRLWHVDRAVTARSLVGRTRSGEPRPPLIDDGSSRALRVHDTGVELWNLDRGIPTDIALDGVVDAVMLGDRRAIAIATRTGDVRIHDATTAAHVRDVTTGLPSITLIAANGRDVAIAGGRQIAIVEGDSWTIRSRRTLDGAVGSLDHVTRGWLVATERDDGPRLDVAVLDDTLATIADHGETDADAQPRMSPDGKWVATRSATTTVIEDRGGGEVKQLPHRSRLQSIAWSPASDRLYVGLVDGGVQVWSVDGWRELARIDAHETWIPSIALAPDGALLFTVGGDGILRTWDTQAFVELHATRVAPDSRISVPDDVRLIASDRLGFVVRSIDR